MTRAWDAIGECLQPAFSPLILTHVLVGAAILIAALIMHGLTPGPRMFTQQPQMVADIYAAMLAASLIMLGIGLVGQKFFALVIRVPMRLIIPVVLFLCCIGAYMDSNSIFSIYVMLFFAVLGYFSRKLGFSFVTFLIGFVIGPNLELTFRQSLQILNHDPTRLAGHPVAVAFLVLTVLTVVGIAFSNSRRAVRESLAARAATSNPRKLEEEPR